MNPPRIYLIAVLLLALGVGANGQELPKAVLVDEFGRYPCDGFKGRIDVFLQELRDHPSWTGLVINIGRGDEEIGAIMREEMIRNHVAFRGFEASTIRYSRSIGDDFKTQFFRDQEGKDSSQRNYVLSSLTSPVRFEDYEFDDLCPPLDMKELFATLLEHNPQIRATVLIRDETMSKADKREIKLSKYLFQQRRIDAGRVRFFRTAKPAFDYGMDPYFEFRLLP